LQLSIKWHIITNKSTPKVFGRVKIKQQKMDLNKINPKKINLKIDITINIIDTKFVLKL
jgi:hypothetical protein